MIDGLDGLVPGRRGWGSAEEIFALSLSPLEANKTIVAQVHPKAMPSRSDHARPRPGRTVPSVKDDGVGSTIDRWPEKISL
jgi:hypothetical protein